jgi:hypothetical protein
VAPGPLFSGASGTIFSIRRAYAAGKGAAVTPYKSTLRSTVSATTCSIRPRPASAGASATTISPNTIEASPRGPNQPIKQVDVEQLLEQAQRFRGFWPVVAQLPQSHPFTVRRIKVLHNAGFFDAPVANPATGGVVTAES